MNDFTLDNVVMGMSRMRSEHDIRSMIDYLTARDPQHPDIGILRWVLGEGATMPPAGMVPTAEFEATVNMRLNHLMEPLQKMIKQQADEITDLREKLSRFITPVQRVQP